MGDRPAPDLSPLRTAVLEDVRAEASRIVDEARARATMAVAVARAESLRAVGSALAAGAAEGELAAAEALRAGRRRRRAIVLTAQRQVYDELRRQVAEAARALAAGPDGEALARELTRAALRRLGDGAVQVRPAPGGGVLARHGARSLDLSLAGLAGRALAARGVEAARLWSVAP